MSAARRKLLLVEDDQYVRLAVREFMELHGCEVIEADSVQSGRALFQTDRPDAVLADHALPDGDALDLIRSLREMDDGVPIVVLTALGTVDLAVRAMQAGADHFFSKPIELPAVLVVLERLLEHRRNRRRELARESRDQRAAVDPFLGTSEAIRELRRQAERLTGTDRPLLITGETGSGKGVLAQWLHRQSPRQKEAFVDLNCAGLSRELLDSELFGHERGAFTGALQAKPGLLEIAHRGTAFLDEIGDMDLAVQPKLLKVIEDQRFRRVGEIHDRRVDVRLIAATHHDLAQMVRAGQFRADLYFRVNTVQLRVPALRERPEDIPLLARELLRVIGRARRLSGRAEAALSRYRWPGNVRELRNALERAVLLSERTELEPEDFLFEPTEGGVAAPGGAGEDMTIDQVVRLHIERVMREENENVVRASVRLGIPKSTLYQKLKKMQG